MVDIIRVLAGPDQSVCGNTAELSGKSTEASFQWYNLISSGTFANAKSLKTTYTASKEDLIRGYALVELRTTNTSCIKSDTVSIQFIKPTIPPFLNVISCGAPVILHTYSYVPGTMQWTSTGSGTFLNATRDTTTYTPSLADIKAGSVTLTATKNKDACVSSEQVTITYVTSPIVNAGSDESICGSKVLLSGSVIGSVGASWSSNGSGTFAKHPSYMFNYYTFSAADKAKGKVTFTLTSAPNEHCSTATDQKIVNIVSINDVVVKAGPDQTSIGAVSLNGSVSGSTNKQWSTSGTGVFSPSTAELNATYTPSAADLSAGYVTLTLSSNNGACGTQKDELFVVFGSYSSISGTVFAGGSKVDKAYVSLFKVHNSFLELYRRDSLIATNNGVYAFDYLPDGTYVVYASPSSSSAYSQSYLPTYYGGTNPWEGAQKLLLNNIALTNKDIQLVAYSSAQPDWNTGQDTVAGAVFYSAPTVAMRLLNASDMPLEAAVVYLKTVAGAVIAYTTTDVNGAYSFKKVKSGNYRIETQYAGTKATEKPLVLPVDGNSSTVETGILINTRETLTTGIFSSSGTIMLYVYPNPAQDYVEVSMNTSASSCTVKFFDQTGQVCLQSQHTLQGTARLKIDLAGLRAGMYLMELTAAEHIYSAKVVKQ